MSNLFDRYKSAQQKLYAKEGVSPVSKFVTTNGVVKNVHYLQVGRGKPLIMVHGGGGNTDQWVNMIRHLQDHYTLYIVDRPGYGLTDAFNYRGVDFPAHCVAFLRSFMEALGISNADFAANSMGGYWVSLFAMKHPEMVNKIVFLGAPAGLDLKLPFFLRLLGTRGINDFLWATIAKPSLKGTRQLYQMLLVADAGRLSEEYIECGYIASILPTYKEGWLTLLESITTLSGFRRSYFIGDKMFNVKQQVLFLWGAKDAFQSTEEGEQIASTMPAAKYITVPDAGHLPWLDQPAYCAEEMIKFLD